MMKKSGKRSNSCLDRIYLFIGKTMVFAGAFCGIFFIVSNLFSVLDPLMVLATSFCVANVKSIMIGISVVVMLSWLVSFYVDLRSKRRYNKVKRAIRETEFIR